MLTLKKLKQIKRDTIFAKGEIVDNENGINMTRSGNLLKWLAVKGWGNDWVIYCHWAHKSWDYIRRSGDKVVGEVNIKKLVPCDDEAFKRYRF